MLRTNSVPFFVVNGSCVRLDFSSDYETAEASG